MAGHQDDVIYNVLEGLRKPSEPSLTKQKIMQLRQTDVCS